MWCLMSVMVATWPVQRAKSSTWPVQRAGAIRRVLGLPHFNGWCVRSTEADGATTAAIIGSFTRGRKTEHLVALLKRSSSGETTSAQRLVADAVVGGQQFLWRSESTGALWLDDSGEVLHCRLRLQEKDFSSDGQPEGDVVLRDPSLLSSFISEKESLSVDLRVDAARSKKSFDAEGWLGKRPYRWILPCRYHVWTLESPAVVDGKSAVAHVEYNCGSAFPKNWIWSQAHNVRGRSAFLLVGGDFLPDVARWGRGFSDNGDKKNEKKKQQTKKKKRDQRRTWLLAFRSPVLGDMNFRTIDAKTAAVDSTVDPAAGQLRLSLRNEKHLVDVLITASPASFFADRLFVPTPRGFSNDPGSKESFAATVQVKVYEPKDDGFQSFRLVEARSFHNAALEFGGAFLKDQ